MSITEGNRERATSIRVALVADAPEIARLLTALGHPTERAHVERTWASWTAANGAALVAVDAHSGTDQERLAGLVTVHHISVLHRPAPLGRVSALIVDAPFRRQGLGRALVQAAERHLAACGCYLLEITSNLTRVDAHAFYEQLGYARTSYRFAKALTAAE